MNWFGDITAYILKKYCTRRIGTARFVTARIGTVNQRLIGEIELGRPVHYCATGEFIPLLVHYPCDGITIAVCEEFTWNVGEMLSIFGPTQATRQLHVIGNVIIDLAKAGIGIQRIRVLAEEIIVTIIVKTGNRI